DGLIPVVEIPQDDAHPPPPARVLNKPKVRQGFLDPLVSLLLTRPIGELRQPRPARATCPVKVAHDHVVQEYIMQSARSQFRTAEMRVNIQDGDRAPAVLERSRKIKCVHDLCCNVCLNESGRS